jgi:enamine deaminase RidA (YjgF/YER057c/UK114 family)
VFLAGWPFSPAVVAGDLCFISGQPAIDPETGEYRPGTIEEEFNQAFANIRNIAKAAGLGLRPRRARLGAHRARRHRRLRRG